MLLKFENIIVVIITSFQFDLLKQDLNLNSPEMIKSSTTGTIIHIRCDATCYEIVEHHNISFENMFISVCNWNLDG